MKSRMQIPCALALALCAGCAANQQFVHFPNQAVRVEDPSKGRIYVVRTTGSDIGTASIEIWDSGKHVANTAKKSYACWEREPGHAEITGREENTSTIDIAVDSSQVYFIHQHSHMGWMSARNRLEMISEEKGRQLIKGCSPPKPSRCWDHPECRSRPAPQSPSQR